MSRFEIYNMIYTCVKAYLKHDNHTEVEASTKANRCAVRNTNKVFLDDALKIDDLIKEVYREEG